MKKYIIAGLLALGLLGSWAVAQEVNTGASVNLSTGAVKVTVTTPPNDVVQGPTNFTGAGNITVNSQGSGSVGAQVTGTFTGLTFTFQGSVDGTNYFTISCFTTGTAGTIITGVTTSAAIGSWTCPAAGFQNVRIAVTQVSTGTAVITLNSSAGSAQRPTGIQGTATNITGINGTAPSNTNALAVSETPQTSGGLTPYFLQPTASDNHANIKNSAGQLYQLSVTNNSATINYLRLYDAASFNGCNSASNLKFQMAIPANSTNAAGFAVTWPGGLAFASGIGICVTSGYSTTDTTNATASAMSVNAGYK